MTAKDKEIQDLRRENAGLREELQELVQATHACTFCKHFQEPCIPGVEANTIKDVTRDCDPEWRGLRK